MAELLNFISNDGILNTNEDIKIVNPPQKMPIFILIDNSGSMTMGRNLLLESVNKVLSILYHDRFARERADVYILTCSDNVKIVKRGGALESESLPVLVCEGFSELGSALKITIDLIKQIFKETDSATPCSKPLILLFSDGYVSDSGPDSILFEAGIKIIKESVKTDRLIVFSFAIGEYCDYDNLRDITGLSDYSHVIPISNSSSSFDKFSGLFSPD